ncbi:hypothetical protein Tco_0270638 [Tanacetum coccineum]
MTGDRSRLMNFVKKFIGIVRFGNDHFGAIMGYGDYVVGDSVISRVYYVEGLGHNLFSVGQFCDSDLEVAFRKHSCYVRDTDVVEFPLSLLRMLCGASTISYCPKVKPKNFKSAATKDCWFQAMQDEIHKFDRLDVWELVPPPDMPRLLLLKWIYKVKLKEYGDVLKNMARLVAKDFRKKKTAGHQRSKLHVHLATEAEYIAISVAVPKYLWKASQYQIMASLYNRIPLVLIQQ